MAIASEEELIQAIEKMRSAGTDLAEFELKSVKDGFSPAAETMSAFANTNGGTIIYGISEKSGFHPIDEMDVKVVQNGCAQAAREQVEPPVAADIRVMPFEGRSVVIANIPEAPIRQKPCYVKKLGQMKGSFIRTGDGDHRMSVYEIDRFIENQHRSARNDAFIVPEATLDDLDPKLLSGWLSHARESSFGRMDAMDDMTVLANRRVIGEDGSGEMRPTVAGLMAMGSYPQKFFPRLNVVFTSYPTPQKGDARTAGGRFSDSMNIDGPIPEMIVNTVKAASRNMKHGAIVKGALREDVPDYPLAAVREAVANALMHRDYSVESQGSPVLVELFPDRLEMSNPGGLYGSLTVDKLGTRGGTISRNQFLARILEDVPFTDYDGSVGHVVENRGTGYPTITGELEKALMDQPVVFSSLDEFRIIFRHRRMTEQENSYSKTDVEEAVLAYFATHESASRSEIARSAGMSDKTESKYIKSLVEAGMLEGIGSQYSPKRRYRLRRG